MTAAAEVDGVKFDGVDLFLFDPHVSIDSSDDDLKRLADKIAVEASRRRIARRPRVAADRRRVRDGERRGAQELPDAGAEGLRDREDAHGLGIRKYGVVRIDSAASPSDWAEDPYGNTKKIADTFREAADIAEGYGERLAAEGEICWGGMHSWKRMAELLEMVGRPKTVGFQADMAHTLLYTMGYNAPEDRILPENHDWSSRTALDAALKTVTKTLRPWTIDFHVAQNDATVKGSGSHDKTGRHCLPTDPNGKLDIAHHAGFWLHDENGKPTRAVEHICWDGCMFPNAVMTQQKTWNDILGTMVAVRNAQGWD